MQFIKGSILKAGILFSTLICLFSTFNLLQAQCDDAISSFPHEQGFNSTSRPACWTELGVSGTASLAYTNASTNPITAPYEGSHFVVFPARTLAAGTELRLVSPKLATTSTSYLNVDFYWYTENNSAYTSLNEGVQVQYSVNGTSWTDIGPFIPRHDATLSGSPQWKNKIVSLPASAMNQPVVYIGFKFHSENGNNLSIDLVKFTSNACDQGTLTTWPLESNCSSSVNPAGTRTEIMVSDDREGLDYTYSTRVIGGTTPMGGNTGGGNGGGLSVGFVSNSADYRVTASLTGCPDLTGDISVNIPMVDTTTPYLEGDTLLCGQFPVLKLKNSEDGVKYQLFWNGSQTAPVVTGNGWHIDIGTAYSPGVYSVKACKEGSADIIFERFNIREHLPLPTVEGFNSYQLGCWTIDPISGTGSIFSQQFGSPYITAQEGSHYLLAFGNAAYQERLVSPKLSSLLNPVVNLEFYFYNQNISGFTNTTEGVQVQYSIDGTTWINAGPFIQRHDPSLPLNNSEWKKKTILFPPGAGGQGTLYIAFRATIAQSNSYIALDNLSFTNTLFPLPITVEYFKGKMNSGNADLEWKVNCEDANVTTVKFDIERSADGRRFETIHSFSESTNRCLQPFSYRDANPLPSKNYYRVRMTEMDGKFSFTPIVAVLNKESGFELVSVSPTLVQNTTTLHLSVAKNTKLEFNVHDAQGRIVHRSVKGINAGSQTISFSFGHLAAGTYQLTAYDESGEKQNIVFIKQ